MTLRPSLLVVATISALAGACDLGSAPADTEFIRDGEVDFADRGVVSLTVNTTTGVRICSGALIDTRVIVTSAQCVSDATDIFAGFGTYVVRGGDEAVERVFGGTVDAFFGGTVDAFGGTVDAFGSDSSFVKAADWVMHRDFAGLPGTSRHDADIAMILLDADAPAGPLALNDAPGLLVPGSKVRVVGFGYSSDQGVETGTKYQAHFTLGAVAPLSYGLETAATMAGDAGGPTFIEVDGQEYLIGVHSASAPPTGTIRDTRVDAHLGFIDAQLAEWRGGLSL